MDNEICNALFLWPLSDFHRWNSLQKLLSDFDWWKQNVLHFHCLILIDGNNKTCYTSIVWTRSLISADGNNEIWHSFFFWNLLSLTDGSKELCINNISFFKSLSSFNWRSSEIPSIPELMNQPNSGFVYTYKSPSCTPPSLQCELGGGLL